MSEADHGVGSVVIEDEHRSDGGNVTEIQEQGDPDLNHSAVIITGNELPGGLKWIGETLPMEDIPCYLITGGSY